MYDPQTLERALSMRGAGNAPQQQMDPGIIQMIQSMGGGGGQPGMGQMPLPAPVDQMGGMPQQMPQQQDPNQVLMMLMSLLQGQ